MSADPVDPAVLAEQARNAAAHPAPPRTTLTSAGMQKYDVDDARPVLERAKRRETAAGVASGYVARAFLSAGARRRSPLPHDRRSAGVGAPSESWAGLATWPPSTPLRSGASTPMTSAAMIAEIDATPEGR